MRLLFDQNISYRILKQLKSEIEATHVKDERLLNSSDYEIWEFARKNNYTIVTQDSDFNDKSIKKSGYFHSHQSGGRNFKINQT